MSGIEVSQRRILASNNSNQSNALHHHFFFKKLSNHVIFKEVVYFQIVMAISMLWVLGGLFCQWTPKCKSHKINLCVRWNIITQVITNLITCCHRKVLFFQNYPKMKLGMLSHLLLHYFIIANLNKNVLQLYWYNFLYCSYLSSSRRNLHVELFFLFPEHLDSFLNFF